MFAEKISTCRNNVKFLCINTYRTTATSKMVLFVTLVNGFLLLTNARKNYIVNAGRVLDPPLHGMCVFKNEIKCLKSSHSEILLLIKVDTKGLQLY